MRLSWFGEFFSTLDEAAHALWLFGDPSGVGQGWWGIVILLIWGVGLMAIPLLVASRTRGSHEWVSATMGVFGGLAVCWWIFGVLPSAWIYFIDSSKEVLAGSIIPATVGLTGPIGIGGWTILPDGYRLDIASDFYLVVRDLVVVVEHLVAFVLVFWFALRFQKKFPKSLAPGETRPESGGYK